MRILTYLLLIPCLMSCHFSVCTCVNLFLCMLSQCLLCEHNEGTIKTFKKIIRQLSCIVCGSDCKLRLRRSNKVYDSVILLMQKRTTFRTWLMRFFLIEFQLLLSEIHLNTVLFKYIFKPNKEINCKKNLTIREICQEMVVKCILRA